MPEIGVYKVVVRMRRLELLHLAAPDPKSGVSTISPHPHIKKSKVVRPRGFEPLTDALEGHCSIQLS